MDLKIASEMVLFAQGAPLPPTSGVGVPETEKNIEIWTNDLALMVGVGILTLLVLAFFAKQSFGGKKRRKRVSESRSVPNSSSLPQIPAPAETKEKRKRRRQKRSHRPSNPTLGETGGLPPKRDGDERSDS